MLEGGVEMGVGQHGPIFTFTVPSGAQLLAELGCTSSYVGCVLRAAPSLLPPHPSAGGAGSGGAGWRDGLAEQKARCE